MILAAGKGERMYPLTRDLPKPMLTVRGKALIDYHLEALAHAGFRDVVINLHYHAEQLREHVGDGQRHGLNIAYSVEDELLETAGGILAALPLLGDEPFAAISADIYTDYDFSRLVACERLAHLVMVPNPPHHPTGDFTLGNDGVLGLAGSGQTYTWASIGVFDPAFFSDTKPGPQRLREPFDRLIAEGRLTGEVYPGDWTDVGTPERLAALNQ